MYFFIRYNLYKALNFERFNLVVRDHVQRMRRDERTGYD